MRIRHVLSTQVAYTAAVKVPILGCGFHLLAEFELVGGTDQGPLPASLPTSG